MVSPVQVGNATPISGKRPFSLTYHHVVCLLQKMCKLYSYTLAAWEERQLNKDQYVTVHCIYYSNICIPYSTRLLEGSEKKTKNLNIKLCMALLYGAVQFVQCCNSAICAHQLCGTNNLLIERVQQHNCCCAQPKCQLVINQLVGPTQRQASLRVMCH